ncbi:MAG TPA: CHASE3 domain-containing protein, partial [Verrucomicrobiae bacterium]|nr:CHASE3 domain-containing protein [Verrucomicrobiae bacterium]
MATLVVLLLAGGQTYRAAVRSAESARLVTHTQEVRTSLGALYTAVVDAESQERIYLLNGEAGHLADFQRQVPDATRRVDLVAGLVRDNPPQAGIAKQLGGAVLKRLALLQRVVDAFQASGLPAAQEIIRSGDGRRLMEEIRERVKQMDSAEATLLAAREAESVRAEARALGFLLATLGVATTGFFHLFDGIRKQLAIRTRAEEQLRRSEENLAVTLQSIGDAVLTTDLQRRVTRLNPVAEKLTGWTRADAAGKPVEQVFRIVNEETRQPAVIPVDSVLETGEIHGLANHTVLIARDGTERPIADSAAPIRGRGGQTIGVVLVFRDVTAEQAAENALRASETRYRTLFESLDEGFCVVEMIFDEQNKPLDYRFLETNPSFEKQSGLQNALGKTMRELAPGLESHWFETLGRVALTGEPVRYQNRAEQLGRSFDLYAFRIEDPARRRVAILFNDVTERLAAEAKVRQLNTDLERRAAQLDAANKELEAFSYSVSHDLRAPLRHVQGYAEMLQQATEGKLPADAERYLKIIHKAGQDMGQLIDDLLAFCRTGRTEMREGTAPLNPLIADVIRGQELSIKDRNVEWKIASLPMV